MTRLFVFCSLATTAVVLSAVGCSRPVDEQRHMAREDRGSPMESGVSEPGPAGLQTSADSAVTPPGDGGLEAQEGREQE
jgi:hypothetical protein